MVYITAVRMCWGEGIQHIQRVRWQQPSVKKSGEASRLDVIRFIRDGGQVAVCEAGREVEVVVVEYHTPFLHTAAAGRYTKHLLALPRF